MNVWINKNKTRALYLKKIAYWEFTPLQERKEYEEMRQLSLKNGGFYPRLDVVDTLKVFFSDNVTPIEFVGEEALEIYNMLLDRNMTHDTKNIMLCD
jgi:hypothetical protein